MVYATDLKSVEVYPLVGSNPTRTTNMDGTIVAALLVFGAVGMACASLQ